MSSLVTDAGVEPTQGEGAKLEENQPRRAQAAGQAGRRQGTSRPNTSRAETAGGQAEGKARQDPKDEYKLVGDGIHGYGC